MTTGNHHDGVRTIDLNVALGLKSTPKMRAKEFDLASGASAGEVLVVVAIECPPVRGNEDGVLQILRAPCGESYKRFGFLDLAFNG
jgi:hypothetical protein